MRNPDLDDLASFPLLPADQRRLVAEAAIKLRDNVLYVAVIGDFKRGKSTLINALLGAPVLPTGVIPVTAVATLVRWGGTARVIAHAEASEECFDVKALPALVTEKGNPHNRRGLREVVVEYPAEILRNGLMLVDTPGRGSVHVHNTIAARSFIPRVDAALLVLSVDAPLSEAEGKLLLEMVSVAAKTAVCLNKVDQLTASQLSEAQDFVRAGTTKILGGKAVPIYPVAAQRRFDDPPGDDGLAAVRNWIAQSVAADRPAILRERGLRIAQSAYRLASSALRLERAALLQPVTVAAERRAAFEAERAALFLDARGATNRLVDAVQHITETVINPAADRLRQELPPRLVVSTDERWADELAVAASVWRAEAEPQCAEALRVAPAQHLERLRERVGGFVAKTGELFDVSLLAPIEVEGSLDFPPIRITMIDEPGFLEMSIRGVRRILPGPLGRRWRKQARWKRAHEDADRLAGRLRYAAAQAVKGAAQEWASAVDSRWRAIAQALTEAIERSTAAATRGEAVIAEAWERLRRLEDQLSSIAERLGDPVAR